MGSPRERRDPKPLPWGGAGGGSFQGNWGEGGGSRVRGGSGAALGWGLLTWGGLGLQGGNWGARRVLGFQEGFGVQGWFWVWVIVQGTLGCREGTGVQEGNWGGAFWGAGRGFWFEGFGVLGGDWGA